MDCEGRPAYYAVGLSDSLSRELAPFNIRVLLGEPGGFRTNFLNTYLEPAAGLTEDNLRMLLSEASIYFPSGHGKQPGDPIKAAERILEAVYGNGTGISKENFFNCHWVQMLSTELVQKWRL